jgi:hypothetical protein
MLDFSIGDRVCFESGNHGLIEGILTRYNKRTVTVITDDPSPVECLAGLSAQSGPS